MKKVGILILSVFILLITSCNPKEVITEYQQGDQVIKDGVIYTYYTRETLYNEHIPFVEEENYKPYYNYYYYDMSDVKNQREIVTFNHFPYPNGSAKYGDADVIEGFLKNCSTLYSPTEAYFFRLRDYMDDDDQLAYGRGFLVTGYTKDLKKNVVVSRTLNEQRVLGLGFKAFENAPMESLLVERTYDLYQVLIHPFAISNCPNLKSINLSSATVLSMGISNCPNVEKIEDVRLGYDCSLYNLPKLNEICELMIYGQRGLQDMMFPFAIGMRKSTIYLCPSFEKISYYTINSHSNVMRRGNVLYCKREVIPFYAFDNYEIILFDKFYENLSFEHYILSICYDPDTLTMYFPSINNGLNFKGKFYIEPNSELYIEKEDGFYANISYPKIVTGVEYFPKEMNEPVLLKIAPKAMN